MADLSYALLGPAWEDRGGFGSFVVPSSSALRPQDFELSELPSVLEAPPKQSTDWTLLVTSAKRLKWQPALTFWAELIEDPRAVEGIDQHIAKDGLDPNRPAVLSGSRMTLRTLKVDSGVPEQPIGADEGARGAFERARHESVQVQVDAEILQGHSVAVVSFENYFAFEPVDLTPLPESWHAAYGFSAETHSERRAKAYLDQDGRIAVDRAAVYVQWITPQARRTALLLSDGVAAPMAYVQAAVATGQAVTAGKLMAGDVSAPGLAPLGVSHDAWHAELIPGLKRAAILYETLRRS